MAQFVDNEAGVGPYAGIAEEFRERMAGQERRRGRGRPRREGGPAQQGNMVSINRRTVLQQSNKRTVFNSKVSINRRTVQQQRNKRTVSNS